MAHGGLTTVVTGGAGFLGQALARELRRHPKTYGQIVAADCVAAPGISYIGDVFDDSHLGALFDHRPSYVFHLAGVVSGRAEADFEAGKRVNLDASIALLEHCRRQAQSNGPLVRLIYSSSIAVFGVPPEAGIDDHTPLAPCISYGAHKQTIEVLIDDYSRRTFIDGRALRLSGVVVRPPAPNGALSAFNSDIIREPLAGRDYHCPLPSEATIWLTSLTSAVQNVLMISQVDASHFGGRRALTAPALRTTLTDIVTALGRIEPTAPARVTFARQCDAALRDQFGSWPLSASFERAIALDLTVEASLGELIGREHARGAYSFVTSTNR
jgi:D-erythronate 2-dehydrogenase